MRSRIALATASAEFENDFVDREAVADLGADLGDLAVALGAQHVLHLHRLHGGERLAGLDLLALGDGEADKQPRHRREQEAREIWRLLHWHMGEEGGGAWPQDVA